MKITRRSLVTTLVVLPAWTALLAACGTKSNNDGMGTMPGMSSGTGATATAKGGAAGTVSMPGIGTASAMTSAEYDQTFIDMMVTHHQAAIAMAKVAQRKGEHPEIKTLANGIVSAQDSEIATMKGWRKVWYGSDQIPQGTMGMMAGMGGMNVDLTQLERAQPFDQAFIDAMTPHHQSAIAMATEAQTQAKHQELKALAGQIIAAQQKEIDQMKAWRAQWYPGQ